MKNEILVPLDGSTRAEAILPHAVMVARTTASSITLLSAVEQPISALATTVWMPVYGCDQ